MKTNGWIWRFTIFLLLSCVFAIFKWRIMGWLYPTVRSASDHRSDLKQDWRDSSTWPWDPTVSVLSQNAPPRSVIRTTGSVARGSWVRFLPAPFFFFFFFCLLSPLFLGPPRFVPTCFDELLVNAVVALSFSEGSFGSCVPYFADQHRRACCLAEWI